MLKGSHSLKAFTIVEVIVAMGIFAVVIAGGFAGVHRGYDMIENSRHYTRISQILQSELESLRTLSWEDITDLPESQEISIDTQFETVAYDLYTVQREIISEQADRRRVEVSVSFINQSGREVSMKYLTYFTRGGVNDYYYYYYRTI